MLVFQVKGALVIDFEDMRKEQILINFSTNVFQSCPYMENVICSFWIRYIIYFNVRAHFIKEFTLHISNLE